MAAGQPVDLLSQKNLEWHHKTKCLVFSVILSSHQAAIALLSIPTALRRRGRPGSAGRLRRLRTDGHGLQSSAVTSQNAQTVCNAILEGEVQQAWLPYSRRSSNHRSFGKEGISHFTAF